MTKPFLALLSITLILGVALGGAFVGGIVLGKSQSANGEQTAGPGRVSAGLGAGFGGQPAESGNGPQSAPRSGQPPVGGPGRSGVAGTIERVDGEKLTITTPQGVITVIAGAEVRIVSFSEGTAEDLSPGSQVRVLGPRTPEGDVQANSILIVPEEAQGFFGRRPGPRRP